MSGYSVWVGGLKSIVQEKDLAEKFSKYGGLRHTMIVRDKETQKSIHCGFVVFGDRATAEYAASEEHGSRIHGGTIIARGPAEQECRGHSGEYDGKIGNVPSIENDKRPYTDCIHYVNGTCYNGSDCPYRHSYRARNKSTPICSTWQFNKSCLNKDCPNRHPGNSDAAVNVGDDVDTIVSPMYALSIAHHDDDNIRLASGAEYSEISQKFEANWATAKGTPPQVKAIFVIKNEDLKRKWRAYQQSLPYIYQTSEEHYHGTKMLCDLTQNEALCFSLDCGICRIAEHGFDATKIKQNIPHFQRFGPGFYLAPKSSKCHDYTQGAYTFRAMLLCDVCPGNKYTLKKDDTHLNGPPPGYHSIYGEAGGSLNYEEIVVSKPEAILPKYIVVYLKNGINRIAK